MGFWPFGARKKSRTFNGDDQGQHTLLEKDHVNRSGQLHTSTIQDSAAMARPYIKRGQDEKPRRLSKQRNPSQPGNVPRSYTMPVAGAMSGGPATRRGSDMYTQNPMSQSSIGPDDFTALPQTPTLLAKPRGSDSNNQRRKSSKRKAEDHAREREVRAMSSPVPVPGLHRPSTYSGSGPLRRDTKQVPGKLNRRLQRPSSEVSLPLPEAIQDSDDPSSQASFKIGILAALSPRPTLTYVANARPSAGKQPSRIKPSIQQAIEEEPISSQKRIDELADELDAGGLRELMERDQRRHERKKVAERERLQRKLQRKADRQREDEFRGRPTQGGPQIPPGQGDNTADNTNISRRYPPEGQAESSAAAFNRRTPSPRAPLSGPFSDPDASRRRAAQAIRNPFEDEKDVDITQDPFAHDDDEEDLAVPMKSPLRTVSPIAATGEQQRQPLHATTISPPTSPVQHPTERQSFSQTSGLGREVTPDIAQNKETDRRPSDQSSQKLSSWTSFFRRGTQRKASGADRGRITPSEFSNTSRESFARKQQPPPVVVPRTFRRTDPSGVTQRTMSKFREDLPEYPISPPDSRVQSPEAISIPQATSTTRQPRQSLSGTLDGRSVATSSSNLALDRNAPDGRPSHGMDVDVSSAAPSGMALSQSLASVDSEGSWLSGKPVKRLSGGMGHAVRQSQSSLPPQSIPGAFEAEDDDLADDEYLNRLTPGPSGRRDSLTSSVRKASSTIIDLERERQHSPVPDVPSVLTDNTNQEAWHEGVARQATVVHQPNRAKSKEGLLKEFGNETPGASPKSSADDPNDDDDDQASPVGEIPGAELQEAPILRAQSVEYKKHGRHASAGSARLLDIRRSSVQSEAPRSPRLPSSSNP